MFDQITVKTSCSRTPWAIACAFIGQILAVGLMLLIPLIYVQALPLPDLTAILVAPPPPPPPPPPPAVQPRAVRIPVRTFDASRLMAPSVIPKRVAMIKDLPAAPQLGVAGGVRGGVPGGVSGGVVGGLIGGILGAVPQLAPVAPPPPPAAAAPAPPAPAAPLRVGGSVEAAMFIGGTRPAYPLIAKEARVQGDVKLDAIIGTDGTVQNLHAVSGSPLLIPAAMNAVKHWIYHPTILDGKPVQVATEIIVHFTIS